MSQRDRFLDSLGESRNLSDKWGQALGAKRNKRVNKP